MSRSIYLLLLALLPTFAHARDEWEVTQPTPTLEDVHGVVAVSDRLVIAGEFGMVADSVDGVTWQRHPAGTHERFEFIYQLNGRLFANGSSGSIFNSDDGIIWAQRTNLLGPGPMAYGNNRYLALTSDFHQQIRVSANGDDWNERTLVPDQSLEASDLAYAYSRFWVGTQSGEIFSSTNGEVWIAETSAPSASRINRIIAADGRLFLLTSRSAYSTGTLYELVNGATWQQLSDNRDLVADFGHANATFFKREGTSMLSSLDASTWTPLLGMPVQLKLSSLVHAKDEWWAVNRNGRLMHSADTDTWSFVGTEFNFLYNGMAQVGDKLIAGHGLTSVDGVTWTDGGYHPYPLSSGTSGHYTAANGKAFVLSQHNSDIDIRVLDRADTARLVATVSGNYSYHQDIYYANGRYLLLAIKNGQPSLATSNDGETWNELPQPADAPIITLLLGSDGQRFYGVEQGRNLVFWRPGDVWSSTDGVSWQHEYSTMSAAKSRQLAAGPDSLIVAARDGYYFKPNGDEWSYHRGADLAGVHFDGTTFNATARWNTDSTNAFLTMTPDGNWSARVFPGDNYSPTEVVTLDDRTIARVGNVVAVRLHDSPLTLTQGLPMHTNAVVGKSVALSVEATSAIGGSISYQWNAGGVDIAGATTPSLTLAFTEMTTVPASYGVRVSDGTNVITAETLLELHASEAPAFQVSGGGDPMSISFAPNENSGPESQRLTMLVNVVGPGPVSYTWTRDGVIIPNNNYPYLPVDITPADIGTQFVVNVANAHGSISTSHTLIGPVPHLTSGPQFSSIYHAATQTSTVNLSVYVPDVTSYQWRRNGLPISGATERVYRRTDLTPEESGYYDMVASNPWGTITSKSVFVTVTGARLTNLSVRANAGSGDATLTPGVVITRIDHRLAPLVRAVGPTLVDFGVEAPLTDPALSIIDRDGSVTGTNDQWWAGDETIADEFSRLGAFALGFDSRDAALIVSGLTTDNNRSQFTAPITSLGGDSGDALVEIYHNDRANDEDRLINLSCRAEVSHEHPLIAGFVISGEGPVKLLIRAAGPALTPFNITDALANPQLILFDANQEEIGNNDTWHHAANITELRAAASLVGAFDFADDSNDAAAFVTLSPGAYTVIVEGVAEARGVALVELYEVP